MPFRKYHRFQNRASLENLIGRLREKGNVPDEAYNGFHRYHPAMMLKIRSAMYHLDGLADKLSTTDVREAAVTTSDFMFEVNMYIDGFFYNAGSSLDILARVVLALFGQPLTGNIYFRTAHARLTQNRPADPILPKLAQPAWWQEFSEYRNTLTHELILASRYQIDIDSTGRYVAYLKPGTYIVDINHIGMDASDDIPKQVEIQSGITIRLDIDIDTGIR